MTADEFIVQMLNAGGDWPDVIGRRPIGRELMQRGLIELVQPAPPYLPYAVLTRSGERRARRLADHLGRGKK